MSRGSLVQIRGAALVAAVIAGAVLPSPAIADEPPPSAVSQYVEMVPTGDGARAVGVGKPRKARLSATVTRRLRAAGQSGVALAAVASSSTYGAPTTTLPKPKPAAPRSARLVERDHSRPSFEATIGAAVSASGTTADARLLGLLAVLVLTTGAATVGAVRSRGPK